MQGEPGLGLGHQRDHERLRDHPRRQGEPQRAPALEGRPAGPEYFLVENRQKTGFDADLPGDGLLVWHIDESQSGNTDENHYKVGLIQADGKRDMELDHNRGDAGDPYPGSANNTRHLDDHDAEHQVVRRPGHVRLADEHLGVRADDDGDGHGALRHRQGRGKDTKDAKDTHKDTKDTKEGKESKEIFKDFKDALKDFHKDGKEIFKDFKDGKDGRKELKEHLKEGAKELKESAKEFGERPPGGGGDGGGFVSAPDDRVAALEARVSAIEQVIGASAQPFIGQELRPDLLGGPQAADASAADARCPDGGR